MIMRQIWRTVEKIASLAALTGAAYFAFRLGLYVRQTLGSP
jgi:hypothetical protein